MTAEEFIASTYLQLRDTAFEPHTFNSIVMCMQKVPTSAWKCTRLKGHSGAHEKMWEPKAACVRWYTDVSQL